MIIVKDVEPLQVLVGPNAPLQLSDDPLWLSSHFWGVVERSTKYVMATTLFYTAKNVYFHACACYIEPFDDFFASFRYSSILNI
jgi:hypothetical protein